VVAITLIENFRAVFYAPFYAAFALGAYSAEGLDVEVKTPSKPSETVKMLLSGEGDVVWGGPMRVLVAGNADPVCGLVSFCEVVARDPFFLIGRGPAPAGGLAGLRGKAVATVSEVPTPWMCLQHDLRLAGVDPGELGLIPGRTMAENAAALRAGDIDTLQVFEPIAEELLEEDGMNIWYAAADRGLTTYTAFSTTRAYMEREPEALLRMTRAMFRTQKWIAAHSAGDFAGRIGGYFPQLSETTLEKALARYLALGVWNREPYLEREGFERLRASCLSGGLIQKEIPYEVGVDMRFAEAAIEEDPPSM
jgi:NitT/TauT family transport system substrate-binding protein